MIDPMTLKAALRSTQEDTKVRFVVRLDEGTYNSS